MPISVTCSQCGKVLQARESAAGKRSTCPDCGCILTIPELSEGYRDSGEKLAADLASKSNALTTAKAEFDKLPAELKDQHKKASEKLTAASKALTEAEREFKKAQAAHSTAENEMQLAIRAEQKTKTALEAAKNAVTSAEQQAAQAKEIAEAAKLALERASQPIRAAAFSPDDALLAALDDAGVIQCWDAKSGGSLDSIATGRNSANTLAWSNADTLVVSSASGSSVLNLKPAWTLSHTIGGDPRSPLADRVNALRFTPDGRQLFTGGGEPTRGGEMWCGSTSRPMRNANARSRSSAGWW